MWHSGFPLSCILSFPDRGPSPGPRGRGAADGGGRGGGGGGGGMLGRNREEQVC